MCGFFKHANGILRLPLPPQEENFSYHDVVKIAKEKFAGYYAIITETTEKMQIMTQQDEVEVNYLKKSFGMWVVNENDYDSRLTWPSLAECLYNFLVHLLLSDHSFYVF